jgi:L-ascorbate metabolism protein UlaG (beta-lactamase superfamily)
MMKITYIGHSGFFVEMEDACFLFDYYKGTIPETDGNKKMYVFVSHRHHDHYNEEISGCRKNSGIYNILFLQMYMNWLLILRKTIKSFI